MPDKPYDIKDLRGRVYRFRYDLTSYEIERRLIDDLAAALESAHEQLNKPAPPAMPEVRDDSEKLEDIHRRVVDIHLRMSAVEARLKTM